MEAWPEYSQCAVSVKVQKWSRAQLTDLSNCGEMLYCAVLVFMTNKRNRHRRRKSQTAKVTFYFSLQVVQHQSWSSGVGEEACGSVVFRSGVGLGWGGVGWGWWLKHTNAISINCLDNTWKHVKHEQSVILHWKSRGWGGVGWLLLHQKKNNPFLQKYWNTPKQTNVEAVLVPA